MQDGHQRLADAERIDQQRVQCAEQHCGGGDDEHQREQHQHAQHGAHAVDQGGLAELGPVELALARGRTKGDKRQAIAERDAKAEDAKVMGRHRKM